MDEDDYFNGEDYVTLDGGINDNNDYPSSNDNGGDGNHHEEYIENYPNVDNTLVGNIVDQPIQETQIVSVQPQVKEFSKDISKSGKDWVAFQEQKEHERNIANEIWVEKYNREKSDLEHQRKVSEAWADMHKRIALEKEVIYPKEDKVEFDKQQLRVGKTAKELDGLKLKNPKRNAPEVEEQYPKITTILKQYKTDYNGFHKQVISENIPIQALHTLSLRKTDSVDSLVVDLIFDLLKDNHLTSLKTLDLSGNQKSIGANQLNKLADSFFSGNNNLETIDISRAYIPRTELRDFIPTQPQKLEERLVKDIFSKSEGASVARLIHSVAFCNQPLCLTLESGVLRSDGNPEEALYAPYTLFSSGMNWMGEPDSFKTTGTEMLNHIRQVIETAHQRAESKQSVSHKPWPESAYKVPHVPDTFTWGITKCLTPKDFSKEGYGELKDKLSEYNPYVRIDKVYDIIQFTQTKLDTFVCITEVMGDRIITHDMLNHQAKWQDAFPIGYLNKNSYLGLGKVNITKQQISEGKTNTQSFDSSCKHCEKSQFDHFLNNQYVLQKNKSKDDYFHGEDYLTLDGGIKDNNDYTNSNNDVSGSHHEETKENYPSGNNTIQEKNVTQVPFSTPEIKIPFKGLSKSILSKTDIMNVTSLDLSHSSIDDFGAKFIADSLAMGRFPNLKNLVVSDNQITATGEGFFAKAMQDKNVQDMILLTKKLDLNAKFIFGNKEEKIAIYKELLQQGKERGIDNDAIVVDTSWFGKIKNFGNEVLIAGKGGWGFAKCQWNPEELLQAYAEDRLIAKLPKALGKLVGNTINADSIVSCYLGATEETWTSNTGQQVLKHELCVMGELEFCDDY